MLPDIIDISIPLDILVEGALLSNAAHATLGAGHHAHHAHHGFLARRRSLAGRLAPHAHHAHHAHHGFLGWLGETSFMLTDIATSQSLSSSDAYGEQKNKKE